MNKEIQFFAQNFDSCKQRSEFLLSLMREMIVHDELYQLFLKESLQSKSYVRPNVESQSGKDPIAAMLFNGLGELNWSFLKQLIVVEDLVNMFRDVLFDEIKSNIVSGRRTVAVEWFETMYRNCKTVGLPEQFISENAKTGCPKLDVQKLVRVRIANRHQRVHSAEDAWTTLARKDSNGFDSRIGELRKIVDRMRTASSDGIIVLECQFQDIFAGIDGLTQIETDNFIQRQFDCYGSKSAALVLDSYLLHKELVDDLCSGNAKECARKLSFLLKKRFQNLFPDYDKLICQSNSQSHRELQAGDCFFWVGNAKPIEMVPMYWMGLGDEVAKAIARGATYYFFPSPFGECGKEFLLSFSEKVKGFLCDELNMSPDLARECVEQGLNAIELSGLELHDMTIRETFGLFKYFSSEMERPTTRSALGPVIDEEILATECEYFVHRIKRRLLGCLNSELDNASNDLRLRLTRCIELLEKWVSNPVPQPKLQLRFKKARGSSCC
jgi:hypothetical protein